MILTYKVDWFDEGSKNIPDDFEKFTFHYKGFNVTTVKTIEGRRTIFCKDEFTFLKLLNKFNKAPSLNKITWKYWSE
jgi:hypothetical protein